MCATVCASHGGVVCCGAKNGKVHLFYWSRRVGRTPEEDSAKQQRSRDARVKGQGPRLEE